MIGIILGLVISDSALTFQQALTLAVQNPLISAPVGLLLVFHSPIRQPQWRDRRCVASAPRELPIASNSGTAWR